LAAHSPVENYAEIQRVVSEELEDFPYHTLQAQDPNTNFSDIATQQQIANQLLSELRFEVTSIHNVTLRDAWSKVIQGCMEMLPAVEALLLNFTEVGGHHVEMRSCWSTIDDVCADPWQTSGMDNSYLFDIKSGVVLATDNRHRNDATLEQVTEYLTRFLQFRDLYK
jgi:Ras-related GTP-binding protein C/D